MRTLFVLAAVVLGSLAAGTSAAAPASVPAAGCSVALTSPVFVPVTGQLRDIKIDPSCTHVYVTNSTYNRLEVYSLASMSLQSPILVGSIPSGVDLTPDGSTAYVANSGGNNLSVVDLAAGEEAHKITTPSGFLNETPISIAVAANGKALVTLTCNCSGWTDMLQLDLATEAISPRNDFWFNGTTKEHTYLQASGDRSKIAIVAGNISSGPVFTYAAATDSFTPEKDLSTFVYFIATDGSGGNFLVDSGTYVLDSGLNMMGTIPGGGWGMALRPYGDFGFRAAPGGVQLLDPHRFLALGTVSVGDTIGSSGSNRHEMAISRDGAVLGVITDNGFAVLPASLGTDTDGDGYPDQLETALGQNPATYCPVMRADVTYDGKVNLLDLARVALDFGQAVPPADPRYDQNADNVVNLLDLGLQAQSFSKNVSSCP